jgi:hypothetical protein
LTKDLTESFRKGSLHRFPRNDPLRQKSRFTNQQRGAWFTQIWALKGTRQTHDELERRIAAFPDEIADRLIQMFSVKGDTLLDPFLGSGTTTKATMRNERSSVGYEIDASLLPLIRKNPGNNHTAEKVKHHEAQTKKPHLNARTEKKSVLQTLKQILNAQTSRQLVTACTTSQQTQTQPEPKKHQPAQTPRRSCARRVPHNNTQRKNKTVETKNKKPKINALKRICPADLTPTPNSAARRICSNSKTLPRPTFPFAP